MCVCVYVHLSMIKHAAFMRILLLLYVLFCFEGVGFRGCLSPWLGYRRHSQTFLGTADLEDNL